MNDDELTNALTRAMRAATAADEPSAGLTDTLVRTRVGGSRRPYLVPLGATAVVTALTAGGFVVADLQGPPGSSVVGDSTSPTPAPTTAAAVVVSSMPSVAATSAPHIVVTDGETLPAVPTSARLAPTSAVATPTTAAPTTTTAPVPTDDSALFAAAASYSVTEQTVTDPTLADTATTTKTVTLTHNGAKVYYAHQQEATWDDLAALPTDTEAFRAAVKEPGHPPNAVEKGLQELVQQESPLPYPQRRAAMQVAMTMPGTTVTKEAKDSLGRAAVKVSIETAWLLDDYYFDPVSARLLEASSFVTAAWEAHWTPLHKITGQADEPLGTGYTVTYSNWTLTPKG